MRRIRICALQLRAHDRAAYPALEERILSDIDAAAADSDLLVAPEGTIPAYVLGYEPVDAKQIDAAVDRLRDIARARSCVIVAGVALPGPQGTANAALAIDSDGSVAGRADKVFLWHFDRQWFTAGAHVRAVDTAAGRLGLLVCADGRMPGIARALVDDGAELLVMPTAWVTSGRDPAVLENIQADLLARVRAFENGVPFVAANKCGVERSMVLYCGKSQIVDASGMVLVIAGQHDAQTLRTELDVHAAAPHRARFEFAPALVGAQPARIALSQDAFASDAGERARILETDLWITPEADAVADATLAACRVEGATLFDPGFGIAARAAGYRTIIWNAPPAALECVTIARARALELRMFVIVFEHDRAFVVDPDATVLAGTFGDFQIASFAFDPRKAEATLLVPGTDVAEGLARVAALEA